ncbi:uncharacterized protein [Rhodnius prolixus]|uniref:Uncharacterized protein n=1 Tax=Rhodnius prolixus TaxID=13249 RepID=T1HX19_RHOPR
MSSMRCFGDGDKSQRKGHRRDELSRGVLYIAQCFQKHNWVPLSFPKLYEYLRAHMQELNDLEKTERLERISRVIRYGVAVGVLLEKMDKYTFNVFKLEPARKVRSPRKVDTFKNLRTRILKQLKGDTCKGRQSETD